MAAAGLPQPRPGQTAAMMAEFALAMLTTLERLNQTLETPFQIRIGIHTGPVIAGVIGVNKFIYDVWGETVNLASRLEAHGLPGRIHISEATRRALAAEYECEPRGLIEVKGMGKIAHLVPRQPQERRRARGRPGYRRSPARDAWRRLTATRALPGIEAAVQKIPVHVAAGSGASCAALDRCGGLVAVAFDDPGLVVGVLEPVQGQA